MVTLTVFEAWTYPEGRCGMLGCAQRRGLACA
jgi:hypothetical protein